MNAWFFAKSAEIPQSTDQPLALDGGPHRLGVNVGKFWKPGEKPEDRFGLVYSLIGPADIRLAQPIPWFSHSS